MALGWSTRRQLLYYAVGLVLLVILSIFFWATFLNTTPNCFDHTQNGNELGVDCGGSCALLCTDLAKDPTVLWARAFPAGENAYTIAAYIQNNNVGSGARSVGYTFQLFDDKNSLVKEQRGSIDLPPVRTVPVIVPNVQVGNRTVARVQFGFTNEPVATWKKVDPKTLPVLHVSEQSLAQDASRLTATIVNDTLNDAKKVTVAAVLFDDSGVARAASKSALSEVFGHSSQTLVFTWPGGVSNIVRAEVTILPSF